MTLLVFCVTLTLLGHYLVMKDIAFAEKYGIDLQQDQSRRRLRLDRERKLREQRKNELALPSDGGNPPSAT